MAAISETLIVPRTAHDDTHQLSRGVAAPPNGSAQINGHVSSSSEVIKSPTYRHVAAIHSEVHASCLSHDRTETPTFLGFRNLMVLVLIVMNLRLIIENFQKYGVLICVRCHNYSRADVVLGILLYALVPCHLFIAYIIEFAAAQKAKDDFGRSKRISENCEKESRPTSRSVNSWWQIIAWAHAVNATISLLLTSAVVYRHVHHPLIGTISEVHALIVWLKICSYALTNRDLRRAMLEPDSAKSIPNLYSACPYPRNITLSNLTYFWWAPTLVYQPVYPRTSGIRWQFIAKRLAEVGFLSIFIWLASAQYAAPLLHNSLSRIATLDIFSILERLMKLSTVSLVIWLAGFFALFQSLLNALAEILQFGDREFYEDWWNSPSVGTYWKTWNKPVYHFMKRHIFSPLVGRGWSTNAASVWVFIFSGFLHELMVGIPTHNILGESDRLTSSRNPLIANDP